MLLKCDSKVSNSLLITELGGCNFGNQILSNQIVVAEFKRPTSLDERFLSQSISVSSLTVAS